MSRCSFVSRIFLAALVSCSAAFMHAGSAKAQPVGPQQVANFLGTWCAQGDPSKQTSIAGNGPGGNGLFLTLTNEQGSTSVGNLQGANQIIAPQWQFVVGTLSPDGSQINWSNGTMWARCPGNGGWTPWWPRLGGTWFANGDRSRVCSIRQAQGSLALQNELGQTANGSLVRKRDISTNWNGAVINGHISRDGNRIDWSDGTYWVRDVVYSQ